MASPFTDPEELLTRVSDDDSEVLGPVARRQVHGHPEIVHRSVHVLVAHPGAARLLLQKRSEQKDTHPGLWDTSVGGHVGFGQTYAEAAVRETEEELGLKLEIADLEFLYVSRYRDHHESENIATYFCHHAGPFDPNPDEITEARFWTPAEIVAALGTGLFTPNFEQEFASFLACPRGAEFFVTAPRVRHVHLESVDSTMEAARREIADLDFLLVTAETQTGGRGTRGRPWHSPRGNVYLTVAMHRRHLPAERLRLFPLEAGLALWEAARPMLPPGAGASLRLKWPNDLLWDGRKTAGMLVESAGDHLFVGVGVNIVEAPPIADGGTPSACLAEAGAPDDCGLLIAKAFFAELQKRPSPGAQGARDGILVAWRARALWDKPLRLRDRPGRPEVMPIDLDPEGHLRVRFPDGREETLISEYLA